MRKFMVLGMTLLFVVLGWGQGYRNVREVAVTVPSSLQSIGGITTDSAGYWLVGSNVFLAMIDTGQKVYGTDIPYGDTVVAIAGAGLNDSVRIGPLPTTDNTATIVNFGVRDTITYGAGDVLGVGVPLGDFDVILDAKIIDTCDQMVTTAPCDLFFFDGRPASQQDSATNSFSDADVEKFLGDIVLPTAIDIGANRVAYPLRNTTQYNFPFYIRQDHGSNIWVRLVARGTWGVLTNINCLKLRLTVADL